MLEIKKNVKYFYEKIIKKLLHIYKVRLYNYPYKK